MAGVSSCLKYSMFIFNFIFWHSNKKRLPIVKPKVNKKKLPTTKNSRFARINFAPPSDIDIGSQSGHVKKLCGCIILGISIWIRVSSNAQSQLNIQEGLLYAVDVMIAVGAIIMVLGFFGCCGAMKESRCLLLLFFIGLFLILALQITAGVLGAVYKPQLEAKFNETLKNQGSLHKLSEDVKKLIEKFQEENECCGFLLGIADWGGFPSKSCKCSQTDPSKCENNYYKKTCYSALLEFYKKYFAIIIGIAFGLAVVEVFGLIFSMVLYCQIGKI